MAYTQLWDEAYPPGTLNASDIDTAIQYWAKAIRERMNDVMGITDWATAIQPIRWGSITFKGASPYIQGGTVGFFLLDSTGVLINGLISDAGDFTTRRNLIATNNVIATNDFVSNKAVGKFLPGITSFSFRNFADAADNLLLADNGDGTLRGTFRSPKAIIAGQGNITRFDAGNSGAALTINWNNSNNQLITLTDNAVLTLNNPIAGSCYILEFLQDGIGTRIPTFPASVIWPGGVSPILTTTVNRRDIISLYYNGTNYLGSTGGFNYV